MLQCMFTIRPVTELQGIWQSPIKPPGATGPFTFSYRDPNVFSLHLLRYSVCFQSARVTASHTAIHSSIDNIT